MGKRTQNRTKKYKTLKFTMKAMEICDPGWILGSGNGGFGVRRLPADRLDKKTSRKNVLGHAFCNLIEKCDTHAPMAKS